VVGYVSERLPRQELRTNRAIDQIGLAVREDLVDQHSISRDTRVPATLAPKLDGVDRPTSEDSGYQIAVCLRSVQRLQGHGGDMIWRGVVDEVVGEHPIPWDPVQRVEAGGTEPGAAVPIQTRVSIASTHNVPAVAVFPAEDRVNTVRHNSC